LGALCGAGFALLEGTLAVSGGSQMLGVGLAARATSSLMHITASGLMGWGIASARLEKRYGRLAGVYLLSVSIHGLWNGSVILSVFGALRFTLPGAGSDLLGMLLVLTGIGILVSMLVTIMILLPIINHRLRPKPPAADAPSQSDIIAPLQP
jgi:RsiW-degrading membrane proteinase PrsW (M82 family)